MFHHDILYLCFMMTLMCFTIRQILETFARSHDMFVSFSPDLFTICLFDSESRHPAALCDARCDYSIWRDSSRWGKSDFDSQKVHLTEPHPNATVIRTNFALETWWLEAGSKDGLQRERSWSPGAHSRALRRAPGRQRAASTITSTVARGQCQRHKTTTRSTLLRRMQSRTW